MVAWICWFWVGAWCVVFGFVFLGIVFSEFRWFWIGVVGGWIGCEGAGGGVSATWVFVFGLGMRILRLRRVCVVVFRCVVAGFSVVVTVGVDGFGGFVGFFVLKMGFELLVVLFRLWGCCVCVCLIVFGFDDSW